MAGIRPDLEAWFARAGEVRHQVSVTLPLEQLVVLDAVSTEDFGSNRSRALGALLALGITEYLTDRAAAQ